MIWVQTTDWNGNVTVGPGFTISLDTEAPGGELISSVLTEADTYSLSSGLLRLSGVAADTMGMAATQISVDGQPFVDVTLNDDGSWSTMVYVGTNLYNKNYEVTMKLIDQAGRETTQSKSIYVDIDPPPGFVEGPTPTPPPTATPTTGPSPTPTATPTVNPGATATPTATQGPPLGIEMYLPVIIN